jgi:hypothetical protein
MTKLTISLTAVFIMSIYTQSVFARDVNTLEKVRESLWLKGVSANKKSITMTYANNDLGDSFEAPVSSSAILEDRINEEEDSENTDLPEELFVPLQDV